MVIIAVLMVDQVVKVLVKTNMYLRQWIHVTDWFQILFTENSGMAFGMEIMGKLFLTLFRLGAVTLILWYLVKIIKQRLRTGFIVCVALILAGALGNIIDSVFYGVLFGESLPVPQSGVATFLPEGGGYAPLLYGKVVDMFYFPLFEFNWPAWMPFVGGDHFIFFSPIFNVADASISCGMIALLLFYGKYLNSTYHHAKGKA